MRRHRSLAWLFMIALVAACATPGASTAPTTTGPGPSVMPTSSASVVLPTPSPAATPTPTQEPAPTEQPTSAPTTRPSPTPTPTMIVRGYYFLEGQGGVGTAIVPVLRTVPETNAQATAAMTQLLAGPKDAERREGVSTRIPAGSKLLGITVNDGTATVNLSRQFYVHDGGDRVWGRLAQVTYTLTQFSTVKRVAFEREGTPDPVFPGPDAIRVSQNPEPMFDTQGLIVDTSLLRSQFRNSTLPAIFVDRPAFGAALLSGGRVTGLTNVPEAQFRLRLFDQTNKVLIDTPVTATCGSGCWGTFDVTVHYAVAKPQWGTLRVWDISEANGKPVSIRDYPVYLRPTS